MKILRNKHGFTLIELLMVFIVLGILAQMALTFTLDLKSRASDIMAISDGRNLITVVRNNFVNLEDVLYEHNPGDGPEIGTIGTVANGSNPRPPVFTLSAGVKARITFDSESPGIPQSGYLYAEFYHINGTDDPISPSGKREFLFVANENANFYSLPTF